MVALKIVSELKSFIIKCLQNEEHYILKEELINFFSDDLELIIHEKLESHIGEEDTKTKLSDAYRKRTQKKKRWKDDVLKNYNQFIKDGDENVLVKGVHKELILFHQELNEKKMALIIEKVVAANAFEEYKTSEIQKKIQLINDWHENKESNLCDYIFFHKKTDSQKKASLLEDLAIFIYKIVLKKQKWIQSVITNFEDKSIPSIHEEDEDVNFFEKPNSLLETKIYGRRNRQELVPNPRIVLTGEDGEKQVVYLGKQKKGEAGAAPYFPENYVKRMEEIGIHGKAIALTSRDDIIFSYIMQFRDETFMQHRQISFSENELMKKIYPDKKSFTSNQYESLRMSIFKLLNCGYWVSKKSPLDSLPETISARVYEQMYHYINDLEVSYDEDTGQTRYRLTVSKIIYDDYLNKQITRIYGSYTKILSDLSWAISFPLQQQRINLAAFTPNKATKNTVKLKFKYFDAIYKFTTSKKKAIDSIVTALNEMKDANFLIEDVLYFNEEFIITFLPVSPEELKDIQLNIASEIDSPTQLELNYS